MRRNPLIVTNIRRIANIITSYLRKNVWIRRLSLRCLALAAGILGLLTSSDVSGQTFYATDVSPDRPFGSPSPDQANPGGKIITVVVDPHDPNILYAASEFAGVWNLKMRHILGSSEQRAANRCVVAIEGPLRWRSMKFDQSV